MKLFPRETEIGPCKVGMQELAKTNITPCSKYKFPIAGNPRLGMPTAVVGEVNQQLGYTGRLECRNDICDLRLKPIVILGVERPDEHLQRG